MLLQSTQICIVPHHTGWFLRHIKIPFNSKWDGLCWYTAKGKRYNSCNATQCNASMSGPWLMQYKYSPIIVGSKFYWREYKKWDGLCWFAAEGKLYNSCSAATQCNASMSGPLLMQYNYSPIIVGSKFYWKGYKFSTHFVITFVNVNTNIITEGNHSLLWPS